MADQSWIGSIFGFYIVLVSVIFPVYYSKFCERGFIESEPSVAARSKRPCSKFHTRKFHLKNFMTEKEAKLREFKRLSDHENWRFPIFRLGSVFFLKIFSKTENSKILKNLSRGKKLSNGTKIFESINPIKNHKRFIQFEIMLFSITLDNFMFLDEKCNFAAKTTDFELNLGIEEIYRNSIK